SPSPDEMERVREMMTMAVPLLIGNYVETRSDARGILGWRTTITGRAALEAGCPERDEPFETDDAIAGWYDQAVVTGWRERRSWGRQNGHLGIPWSAGLWMTRAKWDEYLAARKPAALEGSDNA